jgi:uncharacterized repeat protein (TIGR04138 family)
MAVIPTQTLEDTVRADGRYRPEAFAFLLRGLEFTSAAVHGRRGKGRARHVSGRELCEGLRELARSSWGPLAQTVLERWGIRRTRDFGEMVYFLIGLGLLGKQDDDHIEDFDDVYRFDEAFSRYRISIDDLDAAD